MTNTREHNPEEQRLQSQSELLTPAAVTLQAISEADKRHFAPLHAELPNESAGYEWKQETGDIQSYQHNQTEGWLHIDPQGQFHDRHVQPISKEQALEHAGHIGLAVNEISHTQTLAKGAVGTDQGLSL